jgi:O-antigen/teichoic acid export membrane protein
MLPSFVLALGLAACAESFIEVLIGEQWLPCVPYLQILCFSLMLYPLHALNINVLQVVGRSDLTLILRIVKTALATIPLLLGIFFNIYYMLWGSVFVGFVSYLVNAYFPSKLISYTMKEQLLDILPSFLISVTMAAIVYALSFVSMSVYLKLFVQILVGGSVTIILCEVTKLYEYLELKQMVMKYKKK